MYQKEHPAASQFLGCHGRLCPLFLAVLDKLPSIAPVPTLKQRLANERALGVSSIYASQTLAPTGRLIRRGRSLGTVGL